MLGIRREYLRTPSISIPEIKTFIRECLESDKQENLGKQTHTVKLIYDCLVAEKNFMGSYTTVLRTVYEMKSQYVPAQADMPLVYAYDDAIQIDWGEATIYLSEIFY